MEKPLIPNKTKKTRIKKHVWLIGGLALVALVVIAALLVFRLGSGVNDARYQAVYVNSGQVFFGKLRNTGGEYLVLDSAYTAQDVRANEQASDQTTLVKVSDQVYGPEDTMRIRADNVIFWQNLKADSKVQQAIEAKQ